jgi:predicted aspartyl protease
LIAQDEEKKASARSYKKIACANDENEVDQNGIITFANEMNTPCLNNEIIGLTEVPRNTSTIPGALSDLTSVNDIGGKVIAHQSPDPDTPNLDYKATLSVIENEVLRHFLMRLPGHLGTLDVSFLVDSGGTHNVLSLQTMMDAGLEVQIPMKQDVLLGDGEARVEIVGSFTTTIRIGSKHESEVEFQVLRSRHKCAILGMPWLYDVNPRINWSDRTIFEQDHAGASEVTATYPAPTN